MGAGPYQTMAFWYAYRMDIQANSQGGNLIAAGCKGTVQDGSCNFNEFLKHISPVSPGTTTSIIGTDLDPDVESAVKALQNSGYDYDIDQRTFLPSLFDPNETAKEKKKFNKKPFSVIWKGMGDVIKGCRKTLGDVNMGSKLDNVRYCTNMVHYARQSENAAAVIDKVNDYLTRKRGFTFTVETKTVTAPTTGQTWREIDVAATLRNCDDCTQKVYNSIEKIVLGYTTNNKVYRNHFLAIQAVQAEEGRLHRAPSC
ncbi:hypothetical protein LTR37_021241 [Vermiconidia calcicola]|uniref:Uncharacterized protein n=1 Tax=Vermiconidia calcicola TaxID=1690605 RepID=A0ACC3MC33_9PEZI|nr:hypothetical protein LTR37_021241 [Vermiconidia calcicola]